MELLFLVFRYHGTFLFSQICLFHLPPSPLTHLLAHSFSSHVPHTINTITLNFLLLTIHNLLRLYT